MRSLWVRLTAGLVLLLALSCVAVGAATAVEMRRFLVGRLDQQLADQRGRFPASLEHEWPPDADNRPDSRGQSEGTFCARVVDGAVTGEWIVRGRATVGTPLSAADRRVLRSLRPNRPRTADLSGLDDYRLLAVRGDDNDLLITGLPMEPVNSAVTRLLGIEGVVFGLAVLAAGGAAAAWVRVALRPLRRVTALAGSVAELPLSGGEVDLAQRVPATGSGTEVARLSSAFNRMLGHIETSLVRRQQSQERLRAFAADASHELRTPVAAIRGHAELALRADADVPHALRRIQAEATRMGDLVEDLLLLARLDAGRPLAAEPVDLTRLVLDATSDARAAAPGHAWTLELPGEPVEITGDEHRLHQAVANLLANARVHTPPGTTVTVRLVPADDHVTVEVADDGPGIPDALHDEIFDRFVRADPSRSRRAGGAGLGLSIVHGVAAAHGGAVAFTSEPGATVFRVTLPV
ncbi:putative sensor histidine kinase TcrY [Actinomadura rubteroloni]|uniref:histidine kinase n=1 Tax=Actinomadura rubteroloni TaxID=1926885 RepID=A0A2P4UMY5_9ACTN|nr:HAMP domain-containing sensor histidine kinase [Actinomadura rubteroloni]POM26413.1 putative sensor histidine kinase TcrY [Actinomadura rubteroloni]